MSFFTAFSMLFSAGLIPVYLNYRDLGLLDSRWAILLGGAVSAINLIILRTFLQAIPDELEESAKIDGANDWTILWRVYQPLARPAMMGAQVLDDAVWANYVSQLDKLGLKEYTELAQKSYDLQS